MSLFFWYSRPFYMIVIPDMNLFLADHLITTIVIISKSSKNSQSVLYRDGNFHLCWWQSLIAVNLIRYVWSLCIYLKAMFSCKLGVMYIADTLQMAAFYEKPVSALNYSPILCQSFWKKQEKKKRFLSCQGIL